MNDLLDIGGWVEQPHIRGNVLNYFHPSGASKRIEHLAGGVTVTHKIHPNGALAFIVRYRNGEPIGLHQWWDEEGTLTKEKNYDEH